MGGVYCVKVWFINHFDHPVIICAGNDEMVKVVNEPDFNILLLVPGTGGVGARAWGTEEVVGQ